MSDSVFYPRCPLCNKGTMIPVEIGAGLEKDVKYRCTDPKCGVRFDKHGYEKYDLERQDWIRLEK